MKKLKRRLGQAFNKVRSGSSTTLSSAISAPSLYKDHFCVLCTPGACTSHESCTSRSSRISGYGPSTVSKPVSTHRLGQHRTCSLSDSMSHLAERLAADGVIDEAVEYANEPESCDVQLVRCYTQSKVSIFTGSL